MEIPTSINFFGISFHLYGLILGLSLLILWKNVNQLVQNQEIKSKTSTFFAWMAVAALIGARLWHVVTDWPIYQDNLVSALEIWQGGLSIFGAILGGFLGILFAGRLHKVNKQEIYYFIDALAMSLPFTQAFGRLANWVNQELYGLPTTLPWKIFISPENRLSGYQNQEFYHPLFLYEGLGNLLLGLTMFYFYRLGKVKLGAGQFAMIYIVGYGVLRYLLDFLRLDKSMLFGTGLGLNQVIILIVLLVLSIFWLNQNTNKRKGRVITILAVGSGLYFISRLFMVNNNPPTVISSQEALFKTIDLKIGDQSLKVEVVDTSEKITLGLSGRDQIGADGMLFVFANPRVPGFWMKEMKFDLDLIWINEMKIIGITKNVPAPPLTTPEHQLQTYYPPGLVDMVLEIPAGQADFYNLQAGDRVFLTKN
jgi:phosphatidylglycerol:prolipoprotein diacylglycerol transferase